jgi:hypothetical protein
MKARSLIANASFGPEELKVIGQAFDDIWKEMEPDYRQSSPEEIEAVRLKLAHAVLALAKNGSPQRAKLAETGLNFFRGAIVGIK